MHAIVTGVSNHDGVRTTTEFQAITSALLRARNWRIAAIVRLTASALVYPCCILLCRSNVISLKRHQTTGGQSLYTVSQHSNALETAMICLMDKREDHQNCISAVPRTTTIVHSYKHTHIIMTISYWQGRKKTRFFRKRF